MPAVVRRRTVRPSGHALPSAGERGFTLVEVLVALGVIGVVMTALGPFFVNSLAIAGEQRGRQAAIQLANDAVERARALQGTALVIGRGQQAVTNQWNAAPAAVADHLAPMAPAWDAAAPPAAGADAALPTQPVEAVVGGMRYQQSWYVGTCYQDLGVSANVQCGAAVDDVPFRRVVVAVTWPHRACPAGSCVHVTSTLVSPTGDPIFNANRPPPTVVAPAEQLGYLTLPVDPALQLTANWGRLPLTWTASGLPAGLTMSTAGQVTGTPTALGTYTVTARVTDGDANTHTGQFNWVVGALPALTRPSTQQSMVGTATSLPIAVTGGLGPLAWSATDLPAGLSVNATTGVISGTPTTLGLSSVTVTVRDRGGKTDEVTFDWRVHDLAVQTPEPQSTPMGGTVAGLQPVVSGGQGPYTWSAEGLPEGLTIDPATGRISGQAEGGTRYLTTIRVTDSAGVQVATRFVWQVTPAQASDVRITGPDPVNPDQTARVGNAVSLTVSAGGGPNNGYSWTVTGLPPGLNLVNAQVTGTPNRTGQYMVTLRATASNQRQATIMFVWTVTS